MQIEGIRMPSQRGRRIAAGLLYGALFLAGLTLLVLLFAVAPLYEKSHCGVGDYFYYMALGACLALPAVMAYLLVPLIVDRYDPEPWWALTLAFLWGAVVACGFSALINSAMGIAGGFVAGGIGHQFVASVISAPFVEEFWKGAFLLLLYFVLRTEFDGVVDGVIYAIFVALGFACVENIIYYGGAGWSKLNEISPYTAAYCDPNRAIEAVQGTFIVRGIISPWGHPLYTSMTGLGLGIARETNRTWLKILAPLGGYLLAVCLHAGWNGSALLAGLTSGLLMLITIVFYLFIVLLFSILLIILVVREGRIIRRFLTDEVALGTLSPQELKLACSAFGRTKAFFSYGGLKGRRFVDTAATLALKKWHTMRALEGHKATLSMDFIVPLRQRLAQLRTEIGLAPPPRPVPPANYGPQGYQGQQYRPPYGQQPQQPYYPPGQNRGGWPPRR